MEFYSKAEAKAVQQIASRVNEMREQEWRDWSPEQIINPSLRRYSFNHEAMFSFTSIPGSRRIKRMTDIDRWMAFQDVLKEFPRFIQMGQEYANRSADEEQADWVEAIASAAESENMTVGVGTAYQNQFSGGVRMAKPLTVMKLSDVESDIYAEVADNKQLGDTGKHKTLKLLYIHNPGKVAPYRTKSFVRRLREALLGTCGYSLVYAHVADCDQPDKKHNAARDKRFRTHHAWEVTVDNWAHSYDISNLCHYWNIVCGFMVCPSPEDSADVCVCFMAKEYREYLFGLKPELAEQVFEYNERFKVP
jgi:hypothetical protein